VIHQKQRRLPDDEALAVATKYQAGMSAQRLAALFRCHRQTISAILDRHGANRPSLSTDPELLKRAIRLYESGLSLAKVGTAIGVSANTVLTHLRRNEVVIRRPDAASGGRNEPQALSRVSEKVGGEDAA
jgi:DNA-directed RNA polymerase specialized sigma24 family protein